MDGISIDSGRISATGSMITDIGNTLAREINNMAGLLDEIRAGWQSEQAAPRFAGNLQDYLDQATTLKDALISHGTTLISTGRHFRESEDTLAQALPVGPR